MLDGTTGKRLLLVVSACVRWYRFFTGICGVALWSLEQLKCVLFLVSAHKKSLAGLKLAWVMAAVCYIGTAACLVTLMRYAVDCQHYVHTGLDRWLRDLSVWLGLWHLSPCKTYHDYWQLRCGLDRHVCVLELRVRRGA